MKVCGRGMPRETMGKKIRMGANEFPSSHKDPAGKGQPALHKTGKVVYGGCTGLAEKGVV